MFSSHPDATTDSSRPAIPPRPAAEPGNAAGVTQTSSTSTSNTSAPAMSNNSSSSANNAGVDPSAQPSTGFFHNIKKAMSQSSSSSAGGNGGSSAGPNGRGAGGASNGPLEASFDAALGKFHNLSEHTRKLKEHLLAYSQLVFNTLDCSNSVAVEFQACLGGEEPNLYGQLADHLVDSNRTLRGNEDRKRAHVLVNKALQTLDQQLNAYSHIQPQIESRRAKAEELSYYLQKVQGLREKRDAQLAAMSEPSAADTDKLERNIVKANNMQQIYNRENDQLIVLVNQLWRSRVTVVGPALLDFLNAEKELTRVHNDMLDSFRAEDILPSQANREYMDNSPELIAPTTGQSLSQSLLPLNAPQHNAHTIQQQQQQQQPLSSHSTNTAGYSQHQNTQVSGSSRVPPRVPTQQSQLSQQQLQQREGVVGGVNSVDRGSGFSHVELEGERGEGEMVRSEEQVRVGTETVDTERVRLRKYVKTELVSVLVPIRREKVRLEREVLLPGAGMGATSGSALSSSSSVGSSASYAPPTLTSRPSLAADPRTRLNDRDAAFSGPAGSTVASAGSVDRVGGGVDSVGSSVSSAIVENEYEWVTLHEERPVVRKEVVAVERVRLRKEISHRTETINEQVRVEKIDFQHQALPVDLGVQYAGAPGAPGSAPNAQAPGGRPYPYPQPTTSTATTV